jgi:phage portal protein BeeE
MTLMQAVRSGVRSFFTPPAPPRVERRQAGSMWVGAGQADVPAWEQDDFYAFAQNGYGRNELVFSCINQIIDSATQARARIMVDTDSDGDEEEDAGSPLAALIAHPAPHLTQVEFAELYHCSMQVAGNA